MVNYPQEESNIIWEVYKIIRKKCAIFAQALQNSWLRHYSSLTKALVRIKP